MEEGHNWSMLLELSQGLQEMKWMKWYDEKLEVEALSLEAPVLYKFY